MLFDLLRHAGERALQEKREVAGGAVFRAAVLDACGTHLGMLLLDLVFESSGFSTKLLELFAGHSEGSIAQEVLSS